MKWTTDEDNVILENFWEMNSFAISELLPNRTRKAVLHRAKALGMKKSPSDNGKLQSEQWEREFELRLGEPVRDWLVRRYGEGASYRELTAETGINTRSVMRLMKKFDIEPITPKAAIARQIDRNPEFLNQTLHTRSAIKKRARSTALYRQNNWDIVASEKEAEFLDALMKNGLNPVPQLAVGSFNIDFAFPDIKLAVELDPRWHNSAKKRPQDKKKDDFLKSLGWVVLRVDTRPSMDFKVNKVSEAVKSLASTHPR